MQAKLFDRLLVFSLFGTAMWFFGNLYEAIVIAPNLLVNSIERAQQWQNFIGTTNPVMFYIPLTFVAGIVLLILYTKTPKQKMAVKQKLKWACVCMAIAYLLSVYIITQINLKLFFGNLTTNALQIHTLALLWNILNGIRTILLAVALVFVFKAYVQSR